MQKHNLKKFGIIVVIIGISTFISIKSLSALFPPTHNRDWMIGQESMPLFHVEEDVFVIDNFRNFEWETHASAQRNYESRKFDLSKLTGVDVLVSHFGDNARYAHSFLAFNFGDEESIFLSIESRRETTEKFSIWKGMVWQYELIYVAGSEQDLVKLRTDHRKERMYRYPLNISTEDSKKLLLVLAEEANGLTQTPRMFNTLTENCTNIVVQHLEDILNIKFPMTWKILYPGHFDEVLYSVGLISAPDGFLNAKDEARIDKNTNKY